MLLRFFLRLLVRRRSLRSRFYAVAIASALIGLARPSSAGAVVSGVPFWEGKPKLEAKLRDERAVLVSARTAKGEVDPKADLFTINGVGWVHRDVDLTFRLAQEYERLKSVSEHFRELKYDAKLNRVFVRCEALGYQARMLFQLTVPPLPIRAIEFKVIEGHFLGLEGVMGFRNLPQAPGFTEVSLRLHLEAQEIPIPRVLVGVALEVVIQQVAMKLRTHFETTQP